MPVSQWKCRQCGFDRYHRVSVLRKTGARYETPFLACSGCSVMFLNATQFDAYSTANPNVEAPLAVVTPMRRRRWRPAPLTEGGASLSYVPLRAASARRIIRTG